MARRLNRILSLTVVAVYAVVALSRDPGPQFILLLSHWVFLLLLIWFDEEIGDTLFHWNVQLTATSPGWTISLAAWFLLLLPVIMWLVNN